MSKPKSYRIHRIMGDRWESPVVPPHFEFVKTQYEPVHEGYEEWKEYYYYFKEETNNENNK